MIKTLQIKDLGPHVDTTLHFRPKGVTVISGPSESGKSLLIDAALLLFLGLDHKGKPFSPGCIRTGETSATVELTAAHGTVFCREMSTTRGIRRWKSGVKYDSQTAFAAEIGDLAKVLPGGVSALQLILSPKSWVPLAEGKLGGMPLRNVLVSLAPGDDRDEVARLMAKAGHEPNPGDPITPKAAEKARAAANTHKASTAAVLVAARARKVEMPDGVSDADLGSARAIVTAGGVWAGHRTAAASHQAKAAAHEEGAARLATWTGSIDDLGKKPAGNAATIARQRKAASDAAEEARVARDAAEQATHVLEELREAPPWVDHKLDDATAKGKAAAAALEKAEASGDTCPHCSRPDWEEAAANIKALEAAKAAAGIAWVAANQGSKDRADEHETQRAHDIADAEEDLQRLTDATTAADSKRDRASGDLDAALASDDLGKWTATRDALGNRPAVSRLTVAPVAPASEAPTDEAIQAARATIRNAERATGAREQAARQQRAAASAAESAQSAYDAAEANAARAEALVVAVRAAPGARLARCVELLGDIGPVSMRVPKSRGAIEVLIDGLEYWRASAGKQVYADALLRAGFRRALGMGYVPVVVDEIQSWSWELPPIEGGPVWYLRTVAGELTTDCE